MIHRFRYLRLLPAAVIIAALGAPAQAAERRTGVVIANDRYGERSLPTATADAKLIVTSLREAGYDVLLVRNVSDRTFGEAVDEIGRHVEGSTMTVVYFTGVGSAGSRGVRLMAVDAAGEGMPLERLVETVDAASEGALVVVDGIPAPALEDERLSRSLGQSRRVAPGVVIGYSGAVAPPEAEGTSGGNSVFATVFANAVAEPGVGLQAMLRQVRRTVREVTHGRQVPAATGDASFDAVVNPKPVDPLTREPRPALDVVVWSAIKESSDPGDFARYRDVFPASQLLERASLRAMAIADGRADGVGTLDRSTTGSAEEEQTEQTLGTSPAFGVSGDRTPPVAIRTWPDRLPDQAAGLNSLATDCDAVAGDPDDPMRLSPGIRWGLVNMRLALRTCLFELANAPENPRLLFQVGRLFDMSGRFGWAESFYGDAARAGYSAAYANLAYLSMTGRGKPQDPAAAIPLLRKCADLGNPRCRTDLGFAYMIGLGVDKATDEGVLWLRLAGAGGWPNAMDILANMYLDGWGVPKDESTAISLFQAAAFVGNTNAMNSLGHRYMEGRGVDRSPGEARRWFEKAMADGNAFAPLALGQIYLNGDGVKKNAARAFDLFQLSAERGFGEARLRLGDLYAEGVGTKRDPLEAAFNYALTERQSFEHPVRSEFVDQAKTKLEKIRKRLSRDDNAELDRRLSEHAAFNG